MPLINEKDFVNIPYTPGHTFRCQQLRLTRRYRQDPEKKINDKFI